MSGFGGETRAVVVRFVVLLVAIAVVLGLGTLLLVNVLHLNQSSGGGAAQSGSTSQPSDLPTVALSPSGGVSPSDEPSESPTAAPTGIQLTATPEQAAPLGQIDLRGTYPGQDGISLQVQRLENGAWTPFADVRAQVRGGSFYTFVKTSRTGENQFRVLDEQTGSASPPVTVTIG